jgi:Uma2 family endonuclease
MQAVADITLDPEKEYEIVNGIPAEKPMAGARHGSIIMRLGARLVNYVEAQQMGSK